MKHYRTLSLLAAAMALAAGTAVYAKDSKENDAMAVMNAAIPLAQAVTTAEQHAQGKASRAEYEDSKQGWVYDVEVVSGSKVFDVKVDANKGTVLSSAEDDADEDGDGDKNDKKD